MASVSSSSLNSNIDIERPDFASIQLLVISVNQYIADLLSNAETWRCLKLRCISRFANKDYFEFSDPSIIPHLYWGIKSIEAAIDTTRQEERTLQLCKSEEMLQVPALLDECGFTAGIQNSYLISFSYFYLSVVRKLARDEWQAALHFLQAVIVSPRIARTEFATELCASIFPAMKLNYVSNMNENFIDEEMRKMARRYKHQIIYYQVMSYGPSLNSDTTTLEDEQMQGRASIHYPLILRRGSFRTYDSDEKQHPPDLHKAKIDEKYESDMYRESLESDEVFRGRVPNLHAIYAELIRNSSIKCLMDIRNESLDLEDFSDLSAEENDSEVTVGDPKNSSRTARIEDDPQLQVYDQTMKGTCSASSASSHIDMGTTRILCQATQRPIDEDPCKVNVKELFSSRMPSRNSDSDLSISKHIERGKNFSECCLLADESASGSMPTSPTISMFRHLNQPRRSKRRLHTNIQMKFNEFSSHSSKTQKVELLDVVEKAISKLCFSERLGKCEKDYAMEVTGIYKMLNQQPGDNTYAILKDMILDQLLVAISTSKEDKVVRASVFTLTTIISANISALEEIKKKGLRLCDLACALKRNVHEAAILIYLINPNPAEIKNLELLPTLVEVVCTANDYNSRPTSLVLTPPSASLMIIEVLVTAFDYATNNMHLAIINSPHILTRLLDVASNSVEEYFSLATILVKCMQFDGQCRNYISQFTPVAPFIRLLQNDQKRAKFIALEFFHEILRIPRSPASCLLRRIRNEGGTDILHTLLLCLQQLQSQYQILAANLLLQLDAVDNRKGKGVYTEEALNVLLNSLASDESSTIQQLSAFILSNLGGTYTWTGDAYTVAWLVKKAGLTSTYHRNMIQNYEWSDQSLQDAEIDSWSNKIAKNIIEIGSPVFYGLAAGLKSERKNVSRDSLTTIAWLGYEIARSTNSIRSTACDILLGGIEQFLHPGMELEERLLACLCIYNYASGKGMKKLIHFSEGVRESLRRFSSVTWMAEEVHKVSEYYLPNKSRISCVHTQILEANSKCSGSVTALIYYKGLLHGGYSDGSIKVWDIKKQSSMLLWDIKEHRKAVTCFALFEPGEGLLSGSTDKTIRVWQMVHGRLECVEVIPMKEAVEQIQTCKEVVFVITQGHKMKVFDSQRTIKELCKKKKVKCMKLVQGKAYVGCMDSSIKELAITNYQEREIKAPSRSWMMQNKPIHSLVLYKDWLYSASSSAVEGSNIKDWRRQSEPQMSIIREKGKSILGMEVVEDFIYLNCSSSTSILQIWLRGTQQKVGRISAGSRIISLITANDIIICGTEKGLIKGWIPL